MRTSTDPAPQTRPRIQSAAITAMRRYRQRSLDATAAPWAGPEQRQQWLDDACRELGREGAFARALEWQLDNAMFRERGWVGYTCRYRRPPLDLGLDELDDPAAIARSDDAGCRAGRKYRDMTILVMAEFPARLRELRAASASGPAREGRGGEALLTAFMAAVTILHE